MRILIVAAAAAALASCNNTGTNDIARAAGQAVLEDLIRDAVGGVIRSEGFVARDQYRNPAETLAYFGVQPDDTVVELFPGGGYYAEILAPYLAAQGSYWAVGSERQLGTTMRLAVLDGRPALRRRRSHDLVAVTSCMAAHPLLAGVLADGAKIENTQGSIDLFGLISQFINKGD